MRESFERGQDVIFSPSGVSMLPMLSSEGDKVTLSAPPERLSRYDVVFYRRPKTGQLVLHRLIGFTKSGGYIFCGDNQYDYEYGIGDDDILALMTAFTHKGKEHTAKDLSYRFYIHRMMLKKRLHKFLARVYHKVFG